MYFNRSIEWVFYSENDKRRYIDGKTVIHNRTEFIDIIAKYDYIVPICSNIFFFPGYFNDVIKMVNNNKKTIYFTNRLFFNNQTKQLKATINGLSDIEQTVFQSSLDLIFGNVYSRDFFIKYNENSYFVNKHQLLKLLNNDLVHFASDIYYVIDEQKEWATIRCAVSKETMLSIIKQNLLLLAKSDRHKKEYLKQMIKKMILYRIPCRYDSCFYLDGYISGKENFLYRINSIFAFRWFARCIFLNRFFFYKIAKRKSKFNFSLKQTKLHKKLIFLGAPDYDNVGDHAIFLGSIKFLKNYFSDYEIVVINEKDCFQNKKQISKTIGGNDILVFQGGGNIGNEYAQEKLRSYFLTHNTHNKVVIMPSSIYFSQKNKNYKSSIKKAENYYASNNILLAVRETASFEFAQEHFNCALFQCPDMALFIENDDIRQNKRNSQKALICLRNDKETSLSLEKKLQIINYIHGIHEKISITDTVLDYSLDPADSEKMIDGYLDMFSQYSTVYTDRFHGIILSFISKTDCFAIPNYNHKVEMLSKMLGGKEETVLDNLKMFSIKGNFDFKNKSFDNFAEIIKEHIE